MRETVYLDRYWEILFFDDEEEYDWVINVFNEAIQADPENAIAYNNRAVANHELGDDDKALCDLEFAIRFAPTEPTPRTVRAKIFERQGRFNEAIDEYSQAIARGGRCHGARAGAYAEIGEYEAAIEDWSTVIRESPGLQGAFVARAYAYKKIGDLDRYAADMEAGRLIYAAQVEANVRRWQESNDD
jgi:tetratricopeptide (TPR) repeat protein